MTAVVANEENPESSSSDDSVSLLCSFNACQSTGAPRDTEVPELLSEEKKLPEEHQVKAPESVTPSLTQQTSGCPDAASQPGNRSEKSDNCLRVLKCAFTENNIHMCAVPQRFTAACSSSVVNIYIFEYI